jgi:hypothetical protein
VYVFKNVPPGKGEYQLMSFRRKYEMGMRKERKFKQNVRKRNDKRNDEVERVKYLLKGRQK